MSSEETDTENSGNSLSDVSSLDDDFARMQFESPSSEEEVTDDDLRSQVWNEIESDSDAEFQEDHGIVEEVTPTSEDNTINSIDCYRHFITDEIISLMVHEIKRYAEQHLQTQQLSKRSQNLQ
jgi:Tfp pilus assembly protein FimV